MPDRGCQRSLILFLATGFYGGYAPFAPGTFGTVVGVAFFWCFSHFSPVLYLVTTIAFVFLSAWLADKAEQILQRKDAPAIVIDEISGFLVTMLFVPCSLTMVLAGFLLFRGFDIGKVFPSRWIECTIPGGWGVVLDDVVAGVYANIVLQGVRHWM
jgi:phosphatidylglycerophosphatase A